MKPLEKAGGVGALLLAVSFLLLIVSNAVIQPGLGINGPADQVNPAKMAPVATTLRIVLSIPILFAVAFTLTTLGLNDRLQNSSPTLMRIALASGLGGAVLFLAAGMFSFVALPALFTIGAQSPAGVTTAELALGGAVADGLLAAAIFAAGWFVWLASWAALRGGLPTPLRYLGLLFGAVSILAFTFPPLMLLGAIVGLIWALWMGIVLWQAADVVLAR